MAASYFVLGGFPGGDQCVDARPCGVFGVGQFVESSFAGLGACLLVACLVFGALSCEPAFIVGSSVCRVVEEMGNGAASRGGDGRGGHRIIQPVEAEGAVEDAVRPVR